MLGVFILRHDAGLRRAAASFYCQESISHFPREFFPSSPDVIILSVVFTHMRHTMRDCRHY